ncbi:DUF397 domain-containing protein [Streptomyces caniferus]|uniref:DUF397 domain-containing protein n=1 Tax=Streptomyces caniferus TaxID=285557 RepID=A0ABZ1VQ58_9ACTN|nr:DUF397 domain-containing protein [Streptomyces caniferus]
MTLKPSAVNVSELEWTKSSYSDSSNGHDCLEVAWQKSSYSGSNNNDCIEVAPTPDTIHIRDSKNPDGPQLHLRPAAWADFVAYAATER